MCQWYQGHCATPAWGLQATCWLQRSLVVLVFEQIIHLRSTWVAAQWSLVSKLSSLAPQSHSTHTHTGEERPFVFCGLRTMPNLLLFSPLLQLNLFSGLILTENHMACDIMGAGSRAKGKDRAEDSDRTARSPRGDVSRQACREARWGWGGKSRLEVLWVFFYISLPPG